MSRLNLSDNMLSKIVDNLVLIRRQPDADCWVPKINVSSLPSTKTQERLFGEIICYLNTNRTLMPVKH